MEKREEGRRECGKIMGEGRMKGRRNRRRNEYKRTEGEKKERSKRNDLGREGMKKEKKMNLN
jgi:hypothetical protein